MRSSGRARRDQTTRSGRLFGMADERVFERSGATRCDEARRRIGRQYAARIYHEIRSQRLASFIKWGETKIVTPSLRDRPISNSRAPADRRPRSAHRGSASPADARGARSTRYFRECSNRDRDFSQGPAACRRCAGRPRRVRGVADIAGEGGNRSRLDVACV